MNPIRALIFDFDGLLVDTETPVFESWNRVYGEYGHQLELSRWQYALGTRHGFDPLSHLENLAGHPFDRAAALARYQELKRELSFSQPLLPGVIGVFEQASAAGMPRAVASSSDREWVDGWLERREITHWFMCVRTADDVVMTKPAPDLFLSAAAGMGVPPEACLVFEDSPNGIRAARAAGMRCVAVPGAITSQLELPPADLVLPSLDAIPLAEMVRRVSQ